MHSLLDKYFEFFWKMLKAISKIIGIKSTISCCSFIAGNLSYLFNRERQIAYAQLSLPKIISKLKESNNIIIKKNFAHVGASVGEILNIEQIFDNSHISYFCYKDNEHYIKNGAIALSAHLGNIELLAAYHVRAGARLNVIARNPNYSSSAKVLENIRIKYGSEIIWRDDPSSLRKLSAALKSRALIAALIDQDTALDSQYSNFLGIDAAYPITPIKMAIKYKLPIFTSFIYRIRGLRHHIASHKIDYDPEDPQAIEKILHIYNQRLEKIIAAYPEQWIWWHRRWRRQKNANQLPSTKTYIKWLSERC